MKNKLLSFATYVCIILSFCTPKKMLSNQEPHKNEVTVSLSETQYEKIPLLLSVLGSKTADTKLFIDLLQHDLTWSRQFDIQCKDFEHIPTKQEMLALADQGFPLIIFVERESTGKNFDWRLYDTASASMIKGKKLIKKGLDARIWAHELSDILWPILTGQDGFFSTKIAYCKEVRRGKKRPYKYLYVADYDGNNQEIRVPTIVVAPRWGKNGLLFYSECTNSNIRLMYIDRQNVRHMTSNFDGLNMLPSFSQDGNISVYCASRGDGSCQIYYCAPGIFKQLTHNNGNNVSPTITADGKTVYFCSDYKTGKPAIYALDIPSGSINELIHSGLCPYYSDKVNKIAYIKNIKGTMQLCVYDLASGKSEQITFNAGDKDECSWSACGNYLVYSVTTGCNSRIAALNIISREMHWLTKENENCTYPCASPNYGSTNSYSTTIPL